MKKKLLVLFVFFFGLFVFSSTATAQLNNYPLNVTVELTGVSHNMTDGFSFNADPIFQIGGLTIALESFPANNVYLINQLLATRTISCYELNSLGGSAYIFLPPLTAEEDDCGDVGCSSCDFTGEDDDCIFNAQPNNPINIFSPSLGGATAGIYDYVANYDGASTANAYRLHLRITIIPNTNLSACLENCEVIAEFNRYECANNQTDSGNATADAHVDISDFTSFFSNNSATVKSSIGATFPYGTDISLNGSNTTTFVFQVVQDQPWQVTMETNKGCEFSFSGVFDLPELEIIGLNTSYCLTDPPNYIYDAATFLAGNSAPLGTVQFPGHYFGSGITDNNNGSAIFDPFIAGAGTHLITYLYLDYGATVGNEDYVGCEVQADALVNIYPVFFPSFTAPSTMCTSDFPVFLQLNDISSILAQFAALENQFDPLQYISEGDVYIQWYGIGVTQISDGNGSAVFDPASAGVGVHNIQVLVGYPSCQNTYDLNIEVFECASNLRISAALEGAFDSNTNEMRTDLNDAGLLPLSQPFSVSPWNYNGGESVSSIPNNVVDWVLLELRSAGNTNQIVERKAAFLLKNGDIVDINNAIDGVEFNALNANDGYYIVLRHRNHLDVVSATTQKLDVNNEMLYSFISDVNQALGTAQLTEVGTGIYALRAGDIDGNGQINNDDTSIYLNESSMLNQYLKSDGDMNTTVSVSDFNLFLSNNGTIGNTNIQY